MIDSDISEYEITRQRQLAGLNKMARGLGLPQKRSMFFGDIQAARSFEKLSARYQKKQSLAKFTNNVLFGVQFPEWEPPEDKEDERKMKFRSTGPVIRKVQPLGGGWFE